MTLRVFRPLVPGSMEKKQSVALKDCRLALKSCRETAVAPHLGVVRMWRTSASKCRAYVWCAGADGCSAGETAVEAPFTQPVALVLGSSGVNVPAIVLSGVRPGPHVV